jgi:hypothetical protein
MQFVVLVAYVDNAMVVLSSFQCLSDRKNSLTVSNNSRELLVVTIAIAVLLLLVLSVATVQPDAILCRK